MISTTLSMANTPKKGLATLTIEGRIKDEINIPSFLHTPDKTLSGLLKLIDRAKKDKNIEGIVLKLKSPLMGLAKTLEIRNALKSFKKSGKHIYIYSETLSKRDYLLASISDKLYISPQGSVDISGIALELVFLKSTFKLLGINPNFIQIGNYKSASEPYTRDNSSKYQKESIKNLLSGLFNEYVQIIAEARGLSNASVKKLIDIGYFNSSQSLKTNLVNGIAYEDSFDELVGKQGTILNDYFYPKTSKPEKLPLWQLMALMQNQPIKGVNKEKIAIVYMNGSIISGKSTKSLLSDDDSIGSDDFIQIFKSLKNDKYVKGVIIRINSPGGSALASDILWRSITQLSKVKTVVASLSDVAASGGYYIAMACPTIIANPATITGSIGVVGGKFNFKGLYNKIGIKKEIYKMGKYADVFSDYRDFTSNEKKIIHKQMLETYKVFVSKSAASRNMSYEKMHQIAQGKIYTGSQAYQLKLVDHLGGLNYSISYIRKKLGDHNEKLEIISYPKRKTLMQLISARLLLKQQLINEFKQIKTPVEPIINHLGNVQRIFANERIATLSPFFINY